MGLGELVAQTNLKLLLKNNHTKTYTQMNKKVKMFVFIASVILTLGTLHLTIGKCHQTGCFHEFEMRHCGMERSHHNCDNKANESESTKALGDKKSELDSIK